MNRKKIVLIDDQDYGLRQINNAIPELKKSLYKVTHYPSFKKYHRRHKTKSYVVLLDFFLGKDGTYGHKIVNEVNADIIIGFSSNKNASLAIVESLLHEREDPRNVYAVQKLKDSDYNPELTELFSELL